MRPKNVDDLHKLIVVIRAVEEGLLFEDHPREHAAQRPDVQGVVVELQVHEQFRTFVVPRGNLWWH